MSDWSVVWLGTIAIAMVIMTTVQVAVIVVAIRLARQATAAAQEIRRDLRPIVEKATRITDDAQRATALALAQVERVDELLSQANDRVEETLEIVQRAVLEPVRQGTALVAAFRAAVSLFRRRQTREPAGRDDEDALFIG